MPTQTPNLKLPVPLGNENHNRASYIDLINKIDDNAASKQVVTEHLDETTTGAHKAKNIEVVDVNNLFTSTDVEGALKELFTNADNAQKGIANVVGSPALPSNTLAQLVTHIQNAKNTGAVNLTVKGQSANGTDSLDSLMRKIANVEPGKKFASGKANTDINNVVTVHGLDFKPRIVHINYYNPSASVTTYHYMDNITRATTTKGTVIGVHMGITSNGSINGYGEIIERSDHLTSIFYDDGFAAYLNTTSTNVYWYAWE
ncbi:MAG: hypothetical protein RR595_06475 [Lysinibacillus sp.]